MNKIYLAIGALLVSSSLWAQEQKDTLLNKDVRVIREYNPTIQDAFKINSMPESEPPTLGKPRFSYFVHPGPMETSPTVKKLPVAGITSPPSHGDYPASYASFGAGNYKTLWGDLYLGLLREENYNLDLGFSHHSSSGKVELEDGEKVKAPFNDNHLEMNFGRAFDRTSLGISFDLDYNAFEYYGFNTFKDEAESKSLSESQVYGYVGDKKQAFTKMGLNIDFGSNEQFSEEMTYRVHGKWLGFKNKSEVSENIINLGGTVFHPHNENHVSLTGDFSYFINTIPPDDPDYHRVFEQRDFGVMELHPAYWIKREKWNLKAGLKTFLIFDDLANNGLFVTPDIEAAFSLSDNGTAFYASVTGDLEVNDYQKAVYENKYLTPVINVENTRIPVNAQAGLRGEFSNKLLFNFHGGYAILKNQYFFVNDLMELGSVNEPIDIPFSNQFYAINDDGNRVNVGAEFRYDSHEKLTASLKADYFKYSFDKEKEAWNLPSLTMRLEGGYLLTEQIKLDGALHTIGKREAKVGNETRTLDAVVDLSLGARYYYTGKLNFFGKINNLFSSNYEQYYGYPGLGLNVLIGASYAF